MKHKLTQPLKIFGGKHYLANKILERMPAHIHYVETHAGGLSVLLTRPNYHNVSEVVNDLDSNLTTFWGVLREPSLFRQLQRRLQATPFSKVEWQRAGVMLETVKELSQLERAFWFFIHSRQSLAGRRQSFSPLSRQRTRRGMNEQVSSWLTAIEGLPEVHKRLQRVVVLNLDALEVIKMEDSKDTFFLIDPPYYPTSRVSPNVYAHEMSHEQHELLLVSLSRLKGKFLLCGYTNPLYEKHAKVKHWACEVFGMPNHSSHSKTKPMKQECLWRNF